MKFCKGTNLNELAEAGIEPSYANITGCHECVYKNKCLLWDTKSDEIRKKIEKECGVIVIMRCPILMREREE